MMELKMTDQRTVVYSDGIWELSIRSFGERFDKTNRKSCFAVLKSDINRKISVIFYPQKESYIYRIDSGEYSEFLLSAHIRDIESIRNAVKESLVILKDELNIEFKPE